MTQAIKQNPTNLVSKDKTQPKTYSYAYNVMFYVNQRVSLQADY